MLHYVSTTRRNSIHKLKLKQLYTDIREYKNDTPCHSDEFLARLFAFHKFSFASCTYGILVCDFILEN